MLAGTFAVKGFFSGTYIEKNIAKKQTPSADPILTVVVIKLETLPLSSSGACFIIVFVFEGIIKPIDAPYTAKIITKSKNDLPIPTKVKSTDDINVNTIPDIIIFLWSILSDK